MDNSIQNHQSIPITHRYSKSKTFQIHFISLKPSISMSNDPSTYIVFLYRFRWSSRFIVDLHHHLYNHLYFSSFRLLIHPLVIHSRWISVSILNIFRLPTLIPEFTTNFWILFIHKSKSSVNGCWTIGFPIRPVRVLLFFQYVPFQRKSMQCTSLLYKPCSKWNAWQRRKVHKCQVYPCQANWAIRAPGATESVN